MNARNRWLMVVGFLILAGWGFAMWKHSESLAAESARLNAEKSAAELQAQEATEKLKALEAREGALQMESEQLRKKLASASRAAVEQPASTPTPAPDKMSPLLKMLKDPNMRKMMAAQQRMAMPMLYGELVKKLGLSPEEANKLYDLLAEQQVKSMNVGLDKMDAQKPAADAKPDDSGLKEFLGDRYSQYQQYTKTVGERFALDQFARTLSGANSLQSSQQEGLLQIMAEERGRAPANVLYSSNQAPMEEKVAALNSTEALSEFENQQTQINQAVLTRAKSLLSPAQIEALEAYQEQQLQTMKMQLEMSKKLLNPPSSSTP